MGSYDVIVVGAGPAGGSMALHCAKAGLKTLVLEEHSKAGEPVHCGECFSEYASKNIGIELPKKVISKRVKGVKNIYSSGKETVLNEPGFVLEKDLFEQWISEEAEKNGAEVKMNARAESFERKNGAWEVKTKQGVFSGKILADASGVAGIVNSKLGICRKSEPVIGIQHELEEIEDTGYLDFYLDFSLSPKGYLWMIPKSGGRANVGLVTKEKNMAKTYLERFLEKMNWQKKKKNRTFGGLIPASGPIEKTYAEGLVILGDAAGFTSPMFEGGTHLGMKSGQIASRIAQTAFEENDFSEKKFAEYQAEWKKEFPDYGKILEGKKAFYNYTNEEMNTIASCLPDSFDNFSALRKIGFGVSACLKNPKFLSRNFYMAMLSLGYSQAQFYGW